MQVLPPVGRWAAEDIFALLNAPDAVEWRDRVGVVGPRDGSAKPTTRLLSVKGWVAKTHIEHASPSDSELTPRVTQARAPGLAARLWHEDKQWAFVRSEAEWYPVTLCPELQTLRKVGDITKRMHGWTEMIRMGTRVYDKHQLGLDLNPANFGRVGGRDRLYYIDDELYEALSERDVAGAIISRIPEEPGCALSAWANWARAVVEMLEREPLRGASWETLCEELRNYPVTEQFEEHRAVVVDIFLEPLRRKARKRRAGRARGRGPRLTCVFADVHANLPALEAALRAAETLGADSYLFVGDVVGYGPHPAQCIAIIAELERATLIRGNHDHAIASGHLEVGMNSLARRCAEWTISELSQEHFDWLANLPVEVVEGSWMAVHGAPRDPRKFLAYVYELTYEDNLKYLEQRSVPLCFYGHTHVQLAHVMRALGPQKLTDVTDLDLTVPGPLLVNPGSVGQPRDGDPRAAFAIWDQHENRVSFHRADYDVEKTLQDLRHVDLPIELGERLHRGT